MPNDTINNAIKKASGAGSNANYEEIVYEGYGVNGVAVIVNANTDNKNRTAADVRHLFDKCGGNLGTTGCVSYMFEKKGVIVIEKAECSISEDDLMMAAIEAGAEDFSAEGEVYEVTTAPADFTVVTEELEKLGIKFLEAGVQQVPSTYVSLDEKGAERMQKLIDSLEDLDDVIEVFHNWEE
jgi:YebC/PmpR family DNA-binding regulatory protein